MMIDIYFNNLRRMEKYSLNKLPINNIRVHLNKQHMF